MLQEIIQRRDQEKEVNPSMLLERLNKLLPKEKNPEEPFLINISGASAAGKSTISNQLIEEIPSSSVLNLDDYLLGWSIGQLNHDTEDPNKPYFAGLNPRVYDLEKLYRDLVELKKGNAIEKPIFDEVTKTPKGTIPFVAQNVLIFEGIYSLTTPFLELADVPVLVETSLHDRLIRKVVRNGICYGQEPNGIIQTYLTRDEPTYPYFQKDLRSKAQIIVNNPLVPNRDFRAFNGIKRVFPNSDCCNLVPLFGNGNLHHGEKLTVAKLDNTKHILSYVTDGKLLVNATINNEVLDLLGKYYEVQSANHST